MLPENVTRIDAPAIRLSHPNPVSQEDSNDAYGLIEGDICRLSESILVVAAFSGYSYALHLWAIDVSRETVRVGPETIFLAEEWTKEAYGFPVDPKGEGLSDLNFVIPISNTTFAVIGDPGNGYDEDGNPQIPSYNGTHGHFASMFNLDLVTLEIVRTTFAVTAWNDWYYPDELTGDSWKGKLVCTTDSYPVVFVVSQDASVVVHDLRAAIPEVEWSYQDGFSAVAVVGDTAVLAHFMPGEPDEMGYSMLDLKTGTATYGGLVDGLGDDNWALHSCALPDGRVAYNSTGKEFEADGNVLLPVVVTILDPMTGATKRIPIPGARSTYAGWTGGWYSNVRSISAAPDGTIIAGWHDENINPAYAVIKNDELVETRMFTAKSNPFPGSSILFNQVVAIDDRRNAGLYCHRANDDSFGVWLIVEEKPKGMITGVPEINRALFTGHGG